MNANLDLLARLDDRNPFSSRATRPGALSYEFLDGGGTASLIETLAGNNWWGEILGEHGSGKSTLVHSLEEPLRTAGRTAR